MNRNTTSSSQPSIRRKRPHPARTARRAVGAAGVGSMLLMTGYMVANNASVTAATNTSTATQSVGAASKTAASAATPSTVAQSTSKSSG